MLESMRRDLEAINYDGNPTCVAFSFASFLCIDLVLKSEATVESVSKSIASLSKEERLQLLEQDSPELVALLTDLHKRIDEVKNHVVPLLKKFALL